MVTARVVVVGAGPSGLSAAYLLAEAGCQVTLVERLEDPSKTDRTRAFSYALGGHGMPTIRRMGLHESVRKTGALWSTADVVYKAGKPGIKYVDNNVYPEENFWISRAILLEMMLEHVRKQALVDIRLGVSVAGVEYTKQEASVQLRDMAGEDAGIVKADLVLGCDGLRSVVRRQLQKDAKGVESNHGFEQRKWTSDSTGVLYKSLSFGPCPKLPPLPGDKDHHVLQPDELAWVQSPTRGLGELGFLIFPAGSDPKEDRYGSLGGMPDAPMWKAKTADEMYDIVQEIFPNIDIRALVTREEMTKFVDTPPGRFPEVQRCESLGGWASENVGVAFLGDAAKCFPPGTFR